MSAETLTAIADCMVQIKLRHRATIVAEGQVCDCIYYIEKGLVRQYYIKNGVEVTEHLACENSLVWCLESYVTRKPSELIMQTLEPTVLYGFPYDAMQELTKHSYEVCKLFFAIMEYSLILCQHKADVLRFESAKERYIRTLRENPDIIRRSPLHHIASFLQMRAETLSRVRKELNEE